MQRLVPQIEAKEALRYLSEVSFNEKFPEHMRTKNVSLYLHDINPRIDTIETFLNNVKILASSKEIKQLADSGMSLLQHYKEEIRKPEPNSSTLNFYLRGVSNVVDTLIK